MKHKVKIFAVPSHQTKDRTSGVDFARVIQPLKAIDGYEDKDISCKVDFYNIHAKKQKNWVEIADKYDLVFLNYTVLDWQYAAMASCVHGKGKKIIMDLDDNIWQVSPDNIVHNQLKELNAGYLLSCMLDDVDGVTCTNSYLRNVVVDKTDKTHNKIKVMPNQIDLSLYNKVFPAKNTGTITLMHYGSTSHFDDLLDQEFVKGLGKIFSDYPNVKLKTVGAFCPELRYKWGPRYENDYGDVDIYGWIKNKFPFFMNEADIIVAPLRDTIYNRCKSEIKWLETASAGKPGVFSATRPYLENIEHGKTGYLAKYSNDWYNYVKILIESVEKRQEIGQNAYNEIKAHRQQKDHIELYADFIKNCVLGIDSEIKK